MIARYPIPKDALNVQAAPVIAQDPVRPLISAASTRMASCSSTVDFSSSNSALRRAFVGEGVRQRPGQLGRLELV